ncbi:Hypothetical predicted protein [Pelobates cultripes]|uniref:Uncharacterized protein n=1 Tax=Pelobates cultripes TaxID=61616 RepID=A0AAD1T3Z1_PELCU|nr:Hypothetical predicted protein [Pelobates cultripes]
MADGTDTSTKKQSPGDWAAAFQAKFDAVCERFWAQLEDRHQSLQPSTASTTSRASTLHQPDSANSHQTKKQMVKAQPGKALYDTPRTADNQLKGRPIALHSQRLTHKRQPHTLKKSKWSTTRETQGPTTTQARRNGAPAHQRTQRWKGSPPPQRPVETKRTPRHTHPLHLAATGARSLHPSAPPQSRILPTHQLLQPASVRRNPTNPARRMKHGTPKTGNGGMGSRAAHPLRSESLTGHRKDYLLQHISGIG